MYKPSSSRPGCETEASQICSSLSLLHRTSSYLGFKFRLKGLEKGSTNPKCLASVLILRTTQIYSKSASVPLDFDHKTVLKSSNNLQAMLKWFKSCEVVGGPQGTDMGLTQIIGHLLRFLLTLSNTLRSTALFPFKMLFQCLRSEVLVLIIFPKCSTAVAKK